MRIRKGDNISPNEQDIGAFTGFKTLPRPPTKLVICTLMEKAKTADESKNMPFIQFVADHQFTLILLK